MLVEFTVIEIYFLEIGEEIQLYDYQFIVGQEFVRYFFVGQQIDEVIDNGLVDVFFYYIVGIVYYYVEV